MKRLFLHIGPHKTATTFLQNSFASSLELHQKEEYKGFVNEKKNFIYLSANQPYIEIVKRNLVELLRDQNDNDLVKYEVASDALTSLVKRLDNFEDGFLINENLIGPQVGQFPYKDVLYGLGHGNPIISFIEHLNSKLQKINVELIIFCSTRRQDSFLKSTYLNLIADGSKFPFKKYFNRVKNLDLDWNHFVSEVKKVAKTIVIPFELVIENDKKFINQYTDQTILDTEILPSKDQRESLSTKGVEIAIKINQFVADPKMRKKIIKVLKSQLPKKEFGTPDLTEFLNEEFYEKYISLNKDLFDKHIDPSLKHLYGKFYS